MKNMDMDRESKIISDNAQRMQAHKCNNADTKDERLGIVFYYMCVCLLGWM